MDISLTGNTVISHYNIFKYEIQIVILFNAQLLVITVIERVITINIIR